MEQVKEGRKEGGREGRKEGGEEVIVEGGVSAYCAVWNL